jgi:hypothetical protein
MILSSAELRRLLTAGGVALATVGGSAQLAFAGETWPSSAMGDNASITSDPEWLAGIGSVKLVAVDGSTLSLSPTEGGLAMALTLQNGSTQKSSLAFVSDKLGTISDDGDAGHVTGFFRKTDTGLESQYADGHSTVLVINTAGGMSMTTRSADGQSSCMSWYPPDHVFSDAERKAALDAYAAKLGLSSKAKSSGHAAVTCVPAIKIVKNKIAPSATRNLIVTTHPDAMRPKATEISAKGTGTAPLLAIAVRESKVHPIDAPTPTAKPRIVSALAANFVTEPPKAKSVELGAIEHATAAEPATAVSTALSIPQANPAPGVPASAPSIVPPGSGASDCLSVDSDGASLGFRNHCGYTVQFAFCLQHASEPASNCSAGSKTGAVSANGFAAILVDTNIKTADAEHDFRWVACSGDTNNVVAHLDRADPPIGRCVLGNTM